MRSGLLLGLICAIGLVALFYALSGSDEEDSGLGSIVVQSKEVAQMEGRVTLHELPAQPRAQPSTRGPGAPAEEVRPELDLSQEPPSREACKFRFVDSEGTSLGGCAIELVDGEDVLQVTADERGEAELPCPSQGPWSLSARVGDEASSGLVTKESLVGQGVPIEVSLYPLAALSGRVELEGGIPVPGALVELTVSSTVLGRGIPEDRRITAGPGGSFTLLVESGGVSYQAVARQGEASSLPRLVLPVASETNELVLTIPTSTRNAIEGRVISPAGRPVSGASVHLLPAQTSMDRGGAPFPYAERVTDVNGRFSLEEAPGSASVLIATAEGYAASDALGVGPGRLDEATLQLSSQAELRGHVRWADGSPVVGAQVTAMCDACHPGDESEVHLMHHQLLYGLQETRTDSDGAFVLNGLRRGKSDYLVACAPFPDDSAKRDRFVLRHGVALDGDALEIVLDSGELRGSTVDLSVHLGRDGSPMEVMTALLYRRNEGGQWTQTSRTHKSESGRYLREGLEVGATYALAILPVEGHLTLLVGPWEATHTTLKAEVSLPVPISVEVSLPPGHLGEPRASVCVLSTSGHPYASDPQCAMASSTGKAEFKLWPGEFVAFIAGADGSRDLETTFELREGEESRAVLLRGEP